MNIICSCILALCLCSGSALSKEWSQRSRGLVWGSVYGDSFGGPYEFQKVASHPLIKLNRALTAKEWKQLARSVKLVDYKIKKSPYGVWRDNAPKGSITDDTRHKIIFWSAFSKNRIDPNALANSYIQFYKKDSNYKSWLSEYVTAAYYKIDKTHKDALPTQRLWGGMPTQAGQMIYLLNALLYPGNPIKAYTSTYQMNIFDNGEGLDFTSSIVAALSVALKDKAKWSDVVKSFETTDPYKYSKIPFVSRKVTDCLNEAKKLVRLSGGNPKKLFTLLESNLKAKTWWEADVAYIIFISFVEMTKKEPLAAMALAREFGHDTDSYAQLVGAFLGALYTEKIFDSGDIELLKTSLHKNYDGIFKEFE